MSDVLSAVRQAVPRLSATEARIAQTVIEHPQRVVDLTIAELAAVCDASQASIARFCQALRYSGYREFRLAVAAATSREQATRERFELTESEIDPSDSLQEVVAKIAYQETLAIERTARELDAEALDAVVAAIIAASRVDLYGIGSSILTAQDLQQKLSRIGLTAFCSVDSHLALSSAALQKPGNVAIAFSHSGETRETNHALAVARAAGATTVAITNVPESSIAAVSDLLLMTQARENFYRSGAMASRTAQLALVDFLFVRVAQRLYDQMTDSLRLTYEAVRSQRPERS
ncbi:RpiR family transcriptional regulator [Leifsonia xyli subsp. xyli]|uniref:Transcriptional regulator, RpiR family n=2 Tax=Leifsonia xyli subsp. xyli TaxID=59736 RepID=Q6AH41_LEIXX|nr:MurR/RpiR family transcriptional regulator [Leifsonia xyli]AAT88304.1 transcriptional regulator, RpiR family [Leifsonia xyli subsp. xyli str. CTCB07]ODA89742.1 RpiR family transcriptional regulator [Leifsonia xyli subsp. xyli]